MNNLVIELHNGKYAIVQPDLKDIGEAGCINVKVGFVRPGLKCMQYVTVKNSQIEFKGANETVNQWLKRTYDNNVSAIQKHLSTLS